MTIVNLNLMHILRTKKANDEWVTTERGNKGSIAGQIKEDQSIMLDLLNILTYMSSVVTSDISRSDLFKLAGEQDGITAKSMKKIHSLVVNYGYDSAILRISLSGSQMLWARAKKRKSSCVAKPIE